MSTLDAYEGLIRSVPGQVLLVRSGSNGWGVGTRPFTANRHASRTALLHGHVINMRCPASTPIRERLQTAGCHVEVLDQGCCGMAGSFGFEREKFALSQKIAELGVLSRDSGSQLTRRWASAGARGQIRPHLE